MKVNTSSLSKKIHKKTRATASERICDCASVASLCILSILCNLFFLSITAKISGDAVQYSEIAEKIALGRFQEIDVFWLSLFSYWQALFYFIGLSKYQAAVASTLLPGVLLVVPAYFTGKWLYGRKVGLFTGVLIATHPRLIEYTNNGYAEALYLFFLFSGLALLAGHMRSAQIELGKVFFAGIFFGLYFCIRNEAILWIAGLTIYLFLDRRKAESKRVKVPTAFMLGTSLAALTLILLGQSTVGNSLLFHKRSNLSKQFNEQLNPEEASKVIYNKLVPSVELNFKNASQDAQLLDLIDRYPAQLKLTAQKLPTVFASPIILFSLFYFLGEVRKKRICSEDVVLCSAIIFPLSLYPFIHVEPRYFLPLLFPVSLWGASRIFPRNISFVGKQSVVAMSIALFVLVFQVSLALWRGNYIQQSYQQHEEVALWLAKNVSLHETVAGDGFGYIAATAYLTGHSHCVRHVTDQPDELVKFMRNKRIRYVVLYKDFLQKYNPGLLPLLKGGGGSLQIVFKAANGKDVSAAVFKLNSARRAPLDRESYHC
jgi:hypothetical protein